MATKRFTDAEKWKDPFFENLNNNFKLIWLYLLDDCDNAGIWNKSIKRLNFHCNTSVTEKELQQIFKKRLYPITEDKWFIPKFMIFQYGVDWFDSNNKAVISARRKLEHLNIIVDNTLSIPYQYSIDTVKDKDKDKSKDKAKELEVDIVKEKFINQDKSKAKGKDNPKIQYVNKLLTDVTDFDKMFLEF
jgi:hypothetical protein|tara:strand:+ start:285 stop:851 length:567 start_codon:yes stop_codon:yes gene_type:complete